MPKMKLVKSIVLTIATMTAAFIFASPAAAQTKVKTLFNWTGGGGNPESNLIFDSAGNLYGATSDPVSGTTVFEMSPNSDGTWTQTILYAFQGGDGPNDIRPGVLFGADGNLYATSYFGGTNGCGTVFKLAHNSDGSWTENTLFNFDCASTGSQPTGGVTFDKVGNLYGSTTGGGNSGKGVIFQLTPNSDGSWTEKVIHHFTGGSDGAYPDHVNLIFDSTGNLYGVAANGGIGNCPVFVNGTLCGTVYKLAPKANGTWAFTVLHTFTGGADGGHPTATLMLDKSGSLYGTTDFGGKYGFGVVFKLTQANGKWSEQVLHAFKSGGDGAHPFGGLISDASGNLYGDTAYGGGTGCGALGGPAGCGTIYKLTPSGASWTETVLVRFHGTPNNTPFNFLLMDSAGNLFGTSSGYGKDADGSVYEVTK